MTTTQLKRMSGVAGAALALCAVSAFALSAAASGRVTIIIGAAEILREGQSLPLRKDDLVRAGDTLRTPQGGKVQWWMEDDSIVTIATQSRTVVRNFDAAGNEALYQVEQGGMRVMAGTVNPKVLTPVATITGSGDFSTIVCDRRCVGDNGHVFVFVNDGTVRVQNPEGSVEARKGQIVKVASPPTIVTEVSVSVGDLAAELIIKAEANLNFPEIPSQPLLPVPPDEQPGSPS